MTIYIFIGLPAILILVLLLLQLGHRRKIAAQIKAGTDNARDILNSTTEGIITTNSSGEITKFNRAAESIFGYQSDTLIGKSFLLLLPEETHAVNRHLMSGSHPEAAGSSLELMAQRAGGERFPLALTVKAIHGQGEDAFLGMCRDISARKLAEINNRRSQQFMEFLLQTSAIVFYTCDIRNGTLISYVSPNVEHLLGYKPDTISGTAAFWSRHIHPQDHDCIQLSRILRMTGEREDLEYRLKNADGNYRWIADSRTLVNDKDGKPSLLIGCWTDINAKKEAEINLALKEERFQISLKCANLVTWDWVINTGEITWSGGVHDKLGLQGKRKINFDDFTAMAHPEDIEELQSAFRQCLVQGSALDIEYRVVWPDKSVHWIQLAGELINDKIGGPVRMVGTLFDISAQKQLRVASSLNLKRA